MPRPNSGASESNLKNIRNTAPKRGKKTKVKKRMTE